MPPGESPAAAAAAESNDPTGPEPDAQLDRQAIPVDHEQPPRLPFPVVGIGASAGGVEAMSELVTALPADSGMAFVFVQHLPPEHESMMADILGKKTGMPVLQVEDGMPAQPDHLYVIRPGNVLTIAGGRFRLGPQLGRRAANRPVDDFFRSLAEEQRERAICVILSGMGSNGSAGAQAVKAVGGLAIAQDPETAQFPSMPRHLIDQGYADYILRPADIPEVLLQYAGHPYAKANQREAVEQAKRNENHVREILAILRTRTRTDFGGYKKPTIVRRIQRRMGLTRLTDMGDYARQLRQSPSEVRALADDLLIHVTGFFRDPEAWEAVRQKVISPLIARREPESELRAWVTACSSGEEAYTLAMVLVEEAERVNKSLGIKVFATDMAERPLHHARAGVYPGGIESEIDADRLERFFEREDGIYRVKPFLRECVVFAPQNVLSDPPFSRLDIVSCRNLLIYLEPEVQQRVLSMLHFGLREGGALFLGSSETVGGAEELYELIDKRARIFRRIGPTRHGQLDFPVPHVVRAGPAFGSGGGGARGEGTAAAAAEAAAGAEAPARRVSVGRSSIGLLTQRALLEQHVRAAVAVDRDYRVLYYHGNTRPFLEQPAGEPTRELLMLAREGLRGSVRVALHRCAAEHAAATVLDGWLEVSEGRFARVAVTASPVSSDDPAQPEYFVVSFEQLDESRGGPPAAGGDGNGNGAAAETEGELRRIRDELQTTIEELQTSNEELKKSHEEVVSINEELQSSNEELETSKEEMQSLNEELTTVNAQLQAKMEEHQTASNDLTALLSSTDIAVLFLDTNFRIRRFTPATRELMELIGSDVGRPLSDLHRKFEDPNLDRDVRAVLEKLAPAEREVTAENGRTYARRALPYRTTDNRIDGIVITFVDVTDRKRVEREVAEVREYAESIVETLHEPLLVLTPDLTVRTANASFYRHFKVKPADTLGRKVYDLGNGQWDIPALREALERVLPANKVFEEHEVTHTFDTLGRRVMLLNGRRLDHVQLILLGIRDVTAEHAARAAVRAGEERLRRMVNVPGVGVLTFDVTSGTLVDANDAFLEMTGYSREQVAARRLNWRGLTPPEHIPASEEQFRRLAETGRVGPYEKEYYRADGSRSWMLFAGALVDERTVIEYCVDVGARARAEERVRESEERLRLVVEGARDFAMIMLDAHGRITTWNVGAERVIGFTEAEVVDQPGAIIFTPEDRAAGAPEQELAQAREHGSAADERWHVRKDGTRFWGSGVMASVKNADGTVRGFVKVLRDETARKETEDVLHLAKAAAEDANRTKDEFLANLSHELRTPLSALLLWVKLLKDAMETKGTVDAVQLREGLTAIRTSAEVQKDLIDDLLDVSRIASGTLRLQMRDVEAQGVVRQAVDAISPTADTKDVALKVDLGPDAGVVVRADPTRLRQVVWNLLSNAVKFTPAGGRVAVSLARKPGEVELRVSDTGRGIEPKFLPHVFERFRQADPSSTRTEGGMGLGLAITRQLVELHGGTITAESAGLDRGATFTVHLPSSKGRPAGGGGGSVRAAIEAVKTALAGEKPKTDTGDGKGSA